MVVPLLALVAVGSVALLTALTALIALTALSEPALAQQPTDQPIPTPFDPRGGGSGPGLVGAPIVIALGVIGLGVAAALLTALYVRLLRRR